MGFWMPSSGGDRSPRRVELWLNDQGETRCPFSDFPGQDSEHEEEQPLATLQVDSCWDLGRVEEEEEERQQVSAGMLTCILTGEPGISEGQAEGE